LKIIATIPVKNDGWFIEKSIRTLAAWADHVFVADESSDDGSHDIYDKLADLTNVTIIRDRPKFSFNTPDLRNYQLDLARSFDGKNIIFELHADEVMSAEILKNENREKILEAGSPGNAIMMPWITMWDKPNLYRNDDSPWSNNSCWFGYCDDRMAKFDGPIFHGPRVPEVFLKNKIYIKHLSVLHYQFINKGNELSKQALYQVYERNHFPKKSVEHINKMYSIIFDNKNLKLDKIDSSHIAPWIDKGINLLDEYPSTLLNWRDREVLRNFKKNGAKYYENINIWYINWESKRLEAKAIGLNDIPGEEIYDRRDLSTKIAHWWVRKTQFYAFWRLDFFMLLLTKGPNKIVSWLRN
jgi:uncharacterized C2H2 Zn-finger protein